MSVKELPVSFVGRGEVHGFTFRCVARTPKGYVYEVTQPFGTVHYEVFERVANPRFGCVSYPRSGQFGLMAWTTRDLAVAVNRLCGIGGCG